VKIADTNHESHGHKPSQHVKMFATKSVTSLRQTRLCRSNGIKPVTMHRKSGRQSCGRKSQKSATWFVLQTFMICVHDFPRGESFSESRKVGIMELELYHTQNKTWH